MTLAARWADHLSLEDKVAQLMIPRPPSFEMGPHEYVEALGVGGLIVDRNTYRNPRQMAEYIASAQSASLKRSGIPLFVCGDQEGGHTRFTRSMATDVPSNMALAATGVPACAGQSASIQAAELRAIGLNWNLAPDVDVNTNPDNPVIGTRAYSDDPEIVAAFAREAIRAYQTAGLLATAKHFPGHGDTSIDSHLGLPTLAHDRDRLERIELSPFRAAIQAGVASIMSAHMLVPALDDEWIGTLSAPIMTDLLRNEMGFTGIVVTDALEMRGVADLLAEPQAAVESVRAGADTLLTARRLDVNIETHRALVQAVRSGRITSQRFNEALNRVLAAKAEWLGDLERVDPRRAERDVGTTEHKQRALELARRSITVVRDQRSALPLPRDLGEALVVLSPVSTGRTLMERWTSGISHLGQAIRDRAPGATEVMLEYPLAQTAQREVEQALVGARVVVLGTLNAILDPDQVHVAEVVRERAPDAMLVVVALRTPYDLMRMPWIDAFVCAYTSVEPSMIALAEVLFGETPPSGRLPVELPGLYPRGYGRADLHPSG